MADTYRCINAFSFKDRMFPGGVQVQEGDDILETHAAHFVRVAQTVAPVEATTAAPGERRDLTPPRKAPAKKAPAKAAGKPAEDDQPVGGDDA